MASWETSHWDSDLASGIPRSQQRSGAYHRYCPDTVNGQGLAIGGAISQQIAAVERGVRSLDRPDAEGFAGFARFLLRSEAIASSRIEGIAPSAQQVAIAELGQSESVRGVSDHAQLVANNMTVVRDATTKLVDSDMVTVDQILELHRSLLPDQSQHHGLRTVQNWIGSSDWSPIGAQFVPPDPSRVPALVDDLVDYLNGAAHSALVQAALVHAQFETIHPFTDGNGRVGRALIHTVLTRRGLTDRAVLPISLVLATLRDRYIEGLTAFRHDAAPGSHEASAAMNAWLSTFVEAAAIAVEQSRQIVSDIDELRSEWQERLAHHRTTVGRRPQPRDDSAAARLLAQLPEAPVVTATSLARILEVSYPAANAALDELRQAGILSTKTVERGATAYLAREVLDLITLSERRLASTQFDTRFSPPNRPAPAAPAQH